MEIIVGTIVSTSKSGCFLNLTGRAQNISDFKHCLGSSDNSRLLCCELQHISCLFTSQAHSLTLTDDGSPAQVTSDANQSDNSNPPTVAANRQRLTIDISAVRTLEVVPIVSPTSISIDKAGLPLAIFTKVRVFSFIFMFQMCIGNVPGFIFYPCTSDAAFFFLWSCQEGLCRKKIEDDVSTQYFIALWFNMDMI